MVAVAGVSFIRVTWQAPLQTFRVILRYELSISSSASRRSNFNITGSSKTAFTATGLSPFTNYTFEVAAVSGAGRGPNASLTARTDEDGM